MRVGNGGGASTVQSAMLIVKFPAKPRQRVFEHLSQEGSNDNHQKAAMPRRKRANPHRLVEESAAKRREMFQFVPKGKSLPPLQTAATDADSACLSPAVSLPLTEISNIANDNGDAVTQGTP